MVIETERLRLRPLRMNDLDDVVALHAMPEVSRFMGPLPRDQAVERLDACEREWHDRGHGLLALLSRDNGRFLGQAGLRYWPQFDETEIGWVLNPAAWGQGYATEAAHVCADWGLRDLDVPYLTAMIRPDNARSIRVAERLGMTPLRRDVLLDIPVVVHSISRHDWTTAQASPPAWRVLERDGVRLACRTFGGQGPAALLLHGLAGHSGEWADTAAWLRDRGRAIALDQRGHGRSERRPSDVSREANVDDVAFVIEELGLAPVLLIGQSLGGHLALLVAARRPDLMRGLVVAEASPAGGDPRAVTETVEAVGASLRRWPVPFPDREAAIDYFGGPSSMAAAWTSGLETRESELWAQFDIEVLERTLRQAVSQPHWEDWERIRCPTLVVRAGNGTLDAETAAAMIDRLGHAQLVEIPDAAHDLHLDRPAEWRAAVTAFVDSLDQPVR